MNPPNFEQLAESSPTSKMEQQQAPGSSENKKAPGPEAAANIGLEQGSSASPPPVSATTASIAQAVPLQTTDASTTSDPAGSGTSGMPMIADDTDLIEKEWVDKAKQIVAQTSHDPYLQNKEINKVKADYLKKRYNKDLKLVDE